MTAPGQSFEEMARSDTPEGVAFRREISSGLAELEIAMRSGTVEDVPSAAAESDVHSELARNNENEGERN